MASATTSAGKMTKGCKRCRRVPVRTVFSTGILRRNPGTNFALVDLVNLGKTIAREMKVEVFDWSSGLPVPLTLTPCNEAACLVSLAPGTSNFVFADVSNVQFKYEVRISRRTVNRNVILNVSGLSAQPDLTPQTGNNVLQLELVRLKRRHGCL